MTNKFCVECGNEINAKAVICPGCGVRQPLSPAEQNIKNYLVEAILVTLFCCLPFGIVSIVYASQVNGKLANGDLDGANQASANARKWYLTSLISGLVVGVLYILLIVASEM